MVARAQEPTVHVVRTGTANLASIAAGLERVGGVPCLTESPRDVAEAKLLVLPGVGTIGAAIDRLAELDLIAPLRDRIEANLPTLAVCLGMQLLAAESEENPDIAGLGCVGEKVSRFPGGLRVPQIGWNRILAPPDAKFLRDGYFYFANSYCLTEIPEGWAGATAEYGIRFVAAMERGSLLACQFHPELSGQNGLDLLGRWLGQNLPGEQKC